MMENGEEFMEKVGYKNERRKNKNGERLSKMRNIVER
jgi:hypothetical protein